MFQNLRLYAINASVLSVSLADLDVILKIVLVSVTIGYTIHRWYLLNKNSKDENNK